MNEVSLKNSKGLNGNQLKLIAIIAMFLNHLQIFFDYEKDIFILTILGVIGKITLPIMAYFIVEGFHKTSNINKYIKRMGIFALMSYLPFIFAFTGELPNKDSFLMLNVIYTLFLSLLLLKLIHSKINVFLRGILILTILFISNYGDWGIICLIIVVLFDLGYGNFKKQAKYYSIYVFLVMGLIFTFIELIFGVIKNNINEDLLFRLTNIGMFIPVILLYFYNGEKGKSNKITKWGFYLFYPLHLLVLGFIKYFLI